MAKISIKAGSTSKLLNLFIQDSSSTVGAGLGSLAYNTASLTAYYFREGAASAVAITLATMTLGTWATGGFVVVDGTNMLGAYQLALPDAAVAAGAKSVMVYLKGAANMAPLVLEIELTAVDNQSAGSFITAVNGVAQTGDSYTRLGAPAGASVSADVAAVQAKTANLPAAPASTTNITAGTITTVTNLTNAATAGDLTATMKTSVTTAATAATPIAASVTGAVGSVGGQTLANLDAAISSTATQALLTIVAGYVDTEVAAIKAKTDNLPASPAATGSIPSAATIAAAVWDEATAGHQTTGTTGKALISAGAAGDPWSAALPGAYGAGTAGKIVGDNVNATISSVYARIGAPAGASIATDIAAIQADTDNIQTRIPAALVAGRIDANMSAISSSATAADNLEQGALALVTSTCAAGSTTTSIVTNLTEATSSHYNGRSITFTSGALLGQSSSISAYNGSTKTLTVVALTEAPASTDAFVIA